MTTFERFDPFERRITDAIDEIAVARRPDYLDDVLQLTARTSQRPRWSFLERWLPVDTALSRPVVGRRVPLRPLIVLALLTAMVAATVALYFGSQQRVPLPFGPAANGLFVTSENGELLVRDTPNGEPRLLIGGDGRQWAGDFSPDGRKIAWASELSDGNHFMVADADGTNARELALMPLTGNLQAIWAPDSQRIALIYDVAGVPTMFIGNVAGQTKQMTLEGIVPANPVWMPPGGDRILLRARRAGTERMDLFLLDPNTSTYQALNLPGVSAFGPEWTLSGPAVAPDGTRIAFNSVLTNPESGLTYFRVSTAKVDGTDVRLLPAKDDANYSQGWPVYSPDGKWIAMETWNGVPGGLAVNQLGIIAADGSSATRFVGPEIPNHSLMKLWSPDGTRLLVMSDALTIYSIDPETGEGTILPFLSDTPAWQRLAAP